MPREFNLNKWDKIQFCFLIFLVNGTVNEERLTSKTADEIAELIHNLASQSGLEKIRIRKPFHTDNPSIQGQWHPFTNKASGLHVPSVGEQYRQSPQE